MNLATKNLIYAGTCLTIALVSLGSVGIKSHQHAKGQQVVIATTNHNAPKSKAAVKSAKNHSSHMRTPINWRQSSETVPYPDLAKVKDFWIKVSLKDNRTYLYDGPKVIYTMYSTGGMYTKNAKTGKMESMTPTGTYHAEAERGDSFFNQSLNEGANYYVSWRDHGVYLFHSVPTRAGGAYNVKEANKLGKSTGSHGCIRLSIPDAKWMAAHLPVGTKIEIVN